MKFTLVAAVAAFLCVAAVSAAPSPFSDPIFDDLTYNPLEGITEKVKEFIAKVKCSINVVEKEVQNSELKADFEEFKKTVDQLFGEMKKCTSKEDKVEILKCNFEILKKIGNEFSTFITKVNAVNKELATKIRKQIETECVKMPTPPPSEVFSEESVYNPLEGIVQKVKELVAKVKCAMNVVEKEVANSELKADYEQFKKTIDQLFSEMKKCSSNEDKLEFLKCNIEIIKKMGNEVNAFITKVSAVNKDLATKIRKQIETECVKKTEPTPPPSTEQFFNEDNFDKDFTAGWKCYINIIGQQVQNTELEADFEQMKKTTYQFFTELEECTSFKCKIQITKKIGNEISTFITKVSTVNKELAAEILRQVETKCVKTIELPSTPEDFAFNPLEGIKETIKAFIDKIKCAMNVIEKEVENSELKADFEEFKKNVDELLEELKVCAFEKNVRDFLKCSFKVNQKFANAFKAFITKVNAVNKELATKIRKEIQTQCIKKTEPTSPPTPEEFQFSSLDDIKKTLKAFIARIKCAMNVAEKNIEDSELKADFEQFKKEVDELLGESKTCAKKDSVPDFAKCSFEVNKQFARMFLEFINKINAVNKELATKIRKEIRTQCASKPESFDLEIEDIEDVEKIQSFIVEGNVKLPKFLQKIKCQSRRIRDTCVGTKWQPIFDEHRDIMWKAEDEIKECQQKESNKLKQAKCMIKPLKEAVASFGPFYKGLAQLFKETRTQDKELGAKISAELQKCNV